MDKRLFSALAAIAMGASFASAAGWVGIDFSQYDTGANWTNIAASAGTWQMLEGDGSEVVETNSTRALKLDTASNLLTYTAASATAAGSVVTTDARIEFIALDDATDLQGISSVHGGLALLLATNQNQETYLTYVGYTSTGWVELSNADHVPADGETVNVRATIDYEHGKVTYAFVDNSSVLALTNSAGVSEFEIGTSDTQAHGYALKGSGLVYSITGEIADSTVASIGNNTYETLADAVTAYGAFTVADKAGKPIVVTGDTTQLTPPEGWRFVSHGGVTTLEKATDIVILNPITLTLKTSLADSTETNVENNVALAGIDDAIKSAIYGLIDNPAVTGFDATGISTSGVAYIKIAVTEVLYTNNTEVGAIANAGFDVIPVSSETGLDIASGNLGKDLTFRLPVPVGTDATWAAVAHDGTSIGNCMVLAEEGDKYLQVVAHDFSPYSYELNNGAMPTAAAVDIRAYEGADGVVVEFQTLDENADGEATIDVYKKDGDQLTLIGSVPAVGTGDNLYKIAVTGLEVGGTYSLVIQDEEGRWHEIDGVTVTKFATEMIRMSPDGIELKWASIPGRTYKVMYSATLTGPWAEVASVEAAEGADSTTYFVWSAKLGESATRFFKVVMAEE